MLFSYFQIVILNLLKQEKESAFCDNAAVWVSEFKLLMAVRATATHCMRVCSAERQRWVMLGTPAYWTLKVGCTWLLEQRAFQSTEVGAEEPAGSRLTPCVCCWSMSRDFSCHKKRSKYPIEAPCDTQELQTLHVTGDWNMTWLGISLSFMLCNLMRSF